MEDHILEVRHLRKSFFDSKNKKKVQIVKELSIYMKRGDVLSVSCTQGSGKSTLLRCIAQLETLDGGEVRVCNKNLVVPGSDPIRYAPKADLNEIRLSTGLVFQNFNLFPHLTVLQNITLAPIRVLKLEPHSARIRAMRLLKGMGLEDKARAFPCELSGGQQQRVSIARALAMNPKVLFFDEPTSALDPELTGEILKVIKALAKEEMTMVIVTHEMAFARDVANQVLFMDDGVVVEQGTPEYVFGQSKNERLQSFLSRFAHNP